jgi:hypothetical protein
VLVEVHQQVAGLLGGPGSGRMARHSEYVHIAAANVECEEHVDPLQRPSAVDVEEVHVRHEALLFRMEVRDLRGPVVVAAG